MADRYRGAMDVGVTAQLAARIQQHRSGVGSDFCARYGLMRLVWADGVDDIGAGIAHIERGNPEWDDPVTRPSSDMAKKRDPGSSLSRATPQAAPRGPG